MAWCYRNNMSTTAIPAMTSGGHPRSHSKGREQPVEGQGSTAEQHPGSQADRRDREELGRSPRHGQDARRLARRRHDHQRRRDHAQGDRRPAPGGEDARRGLEGDRQRGRRRHDLGGHTRRSAAREGRGAHRQGRPPDRDRRGLQQGGRARQSSSSKRSQRRSPRPTRNGSSR